MSYSFSFYRIIANGGNGVLITMSEIITYLSDVNRCFPLLDHGSKHIGQKLVSSSSGDLSFVLFGLGCVDGEECFLLVVDDPGLVGGFAVVASVASATDNKSSPPSTETVGTMR